MSYKLSHTAEAIDSKLGLIDKNKNLLPYPYKTNLVKGLLPEGLDDVGDGSILTSTTSISEERVLLNTCALPTGKKYIISLDVRDFIDEPIETHDFKLEIVITGKESFSTDNFAAIDLSADTEEPKLSAKVYLQIPAKFEVGLVIKPQIEEDIEDNGQKTNWVPYMDKIGNYVDERFNSTNTKLKVITKRLDNLTGLPDCANLADGSILVVRGGKWVIESPFSEGTILLVANDEEASS